MIGFAGDSPGTEGEATIDLGSVPFLAVNLPKKTSYRTYTETTDKTFCTLKSSEVATYRKKGKNCKSGWKDTYSDLSFCKEVIETGEEGFTYFGLKNVVKTPNQQIDAPLRSHRSLEAVFLRPKS